MLTSHLLSSSLLYTSLRLVNTGALPVTMYTTSVSWPAWYHVRPMAKPACTSAGGMSTCNENMASLRSTQGLDRRRRGQNEGCHAKHARLERPNLSPILHHAFPATAHWRQAAAARRRTSIVMSSLTELLLWTATLVGMLGWPAEDNAGALVLGICFRGSIKRVAATAVARKWVEQKPAIRISQQRQGSRPHPALPGRTQCCWCLRHCHCEPPACSSSSSHAR